MPDLARGQGVPVRLVDGVPVVTPPAQVDTDNAEQLRRALAAVSADHSVVVVDMTASELADSSGIRALVVAHKRACALAREILVVMPELAALRMSELTGTGPVFDIFDTVPAAVASAAAPRVPGPGDSSMPPA